MCSVRRSVRYRTCSVRYRTVSVRCRTETVSEETHANRPTKQQKRHNDTGIPAHALLDCLPQLKRMHSSRSRARLSIRSCWIARSSTRRPVRVDPALRRPCRPRRLRAGLAAFHPLFPRIPPVFTRDGPSSLAQGSRGVPRRKTRVFYAAHHMCSKNQFVLW
jgi:hypothetical protein